MAKKRLPSPVNAFARVGHDHYSTYGHLTVHVHSLFGWDSSTLKISCQSGGTHYAGERKTTYAWQYGLSNDYSVIGLHALKQGYLLLRRIEKALAQKEQEYGPPGTFADYATRILSAAKVPVVHVLEPVNGQMAVSTKISDLPSFKPDRDTIELRSILDRMEQALLHN